MPGSRGCAFFSSKDGKGIASRTVKRIADALEAGNKAPSGEFNIERFCAGLTKDTPERAIEFLKIDFDELGQALLGDLNQHTQSEMLKYNPETELAVAALHSLFARAANSLADPVPVSLSSNYFFDNVDAVGGTFPLMSGEVLERPQIPESEMSVAKAILIEYLEKKAELGGKIKLNAFTIHCLPSARDYLNFSEWSEPRLNELLQLAVVLTGTPEAKYREVFSR